jgi:predicted DNA-binding transcriptional regulator AlpA
MVKTQESTQACQLWDAKTFGQRLSLSKRQIFRLNSCGKIPAPIRIGGAVRWSEQECSDWLAAGAPDRRTWETLKQAGGE